MPSFLGIRGIDCASGNARHATKCEAISHVFSVHQANDGVPGTASDQGGGHAHFAPFLVIKPIDAITPQLLVACASGQKIEEVVFVVDDTDVNQTNIVTYTLKGVRVKSVKNRPLQAGDLPPGQNFASQLVEVVELRYATIEITATNPLDRTKTSGGGWKRISNTKA